MNKRSLLALSLSALLWNACASSPAPAPVDSRRSFRDQLAPLFSEAYSDTQSVEVFYGTNREGTPDKGCVPGAWSATLGPQVRYGSCQVNVPKRHAVGALPFSDDPRADTHSNFLFLRHESFEEAAFLSSLQSTNQWGVLVFVHGFNVPFHEAVLRAAQIAYDLKFQGKIVLWSWPAGAGTGFFEGKMITRTYDSNKKNAEASIESFRAFLQHLQGLHVPVHLMVHSMGHRVVLPALAGLGEAGQGKIVDELVLNAPDFENDAFQKIAPQVRKTASRITLYCSYQDNAIAASERYNGGRVLGACERADGIDVINVSEIDNPGMTGLGHGYYSSRAIISDLFQVLLGLEAEKRLFVRKSEPNALENYYLRQ